VSRSRNIKPGFFENEDLAELGAEAMLLFAGLWTHVDREGRCEDRPKRIRAKLFPYFDVDVDGLLDALAERGFIERYAVDGIRYIQVTNFCKHQSPHVKEQPSTIPAPDMHQTCTEQAPPDSGFSDSLIVDCGLLESPPTPSEGDVVKTKRRRQIPATWALTPELREYAIKHGIPADRVDDFAEEFKTYWRGDGRVKADWDATFQVRARDQAWRYAARAGPNGQRRITMDDLDRLMEEQGGPARNDDGAEDPAGTLPASKTLGPGR
jgi:hypothetical protein